jgi:carboxylesterase type B
MTEIINANSKGFIVISIQYYLGTFSFLAFKDLCNKGIVNAGIPNLCSGLDQL